MTSNAKNEPNLKLSIVFTFKALVEVEPNNIRLSSKKGDDTGAVVLIRSLRNGIKITGVSFKVSGAADDFQSYIPVQYTCTKVADTVQKIRNKSDKENGTVYKLRITYTPCEKEDKFGEFVIQTNLPDKPELKIGGSLEAKRAQ